MSSRNIKAALTTPDLFHLQPVLTLLFALCQPQLLEEHIGSVKHTRCVSGTCTFVAAEFCKLAGLDLRWFLLGVILSEKVAAKLGGCGVWSAQVCSYLFAYLVTAVEDFYAVRFFSYL
jgi:hypothetical protein